MNDAVLQVDANRVIDRLSEDQRRCLAFKLYTACVAQYGKGLEDAKRNGSGYDKDLIENVVNTYVLAVAHRDAACRNIADTAETDDLLVAAWNLWNKWVRESRP